MTKCGRWRWLVLLWCLGCGVVQAQPQARAEALRAQFAALQAQGTGRIGDRAIFLRSSEAEGRMQGDIYALIDQPYESLRHELARVDAWCGILILHLNVKYCRAVGETGREQLLAGVGRKFDQALHEVHWLRFDYAARAAGEGYLDLLLQAPRGPLDTQDYRIAIQAAPFAAGRSLLHMRYAYRYGLAARWAMQAYLATLGSGKRGFSIVGRGADGQPVAVGGVRGVLERNTMRYYLAIEAYLGAAGHPAAQQPLRRLETWFDATERYAAQLHEIDRDAYLAMKRLELRRQETVAPPVPAD
ncbi:MAG: hypothetical protein Q8K96_11265 [Rubrivivax sp.]|nr:hypothetical protein [Rubrivivax sp.]